DSRPSTPKIQKVDAGSSEQESEEKKKKKQGEERLAREAEDQKKNNEEKKKDVEQEIITTVPSTSKQGDDSTSGVNRIWATAPTTGTGVRDRDVGQSTTGTFSLPKMKKIHTGMRLPKSKGKSVLNLDHLLQYLPDPVDLSNTRATQSQYDEWYSRVSLAYGMDEQQMGIIMNGFMVWCIENGTSPNADGMWTMMDGDQQEEYPLKPMIENAKPTLRQIMAHFSDAAEAYIEMRNAREPYMPRYGLKRNLTDMSLARCAFDFYEITRYTPKRVIEAHMQMKAAALSNVKTRMFGLDGSVGNSEENTERHTAHDVNQNLHTLMGVRGI
nr:CP [Cucurbit vein banding virus]